MCEPRTNRVGDPPSPWQDPGLFNPCGDFVTCGTPRPAYTGFLHAINTA